MYILCTCACIYIYIYIHTHIYIHYISIYRCTYLHIGINVFFTLSVRSVALFKQGKTTVVSTALAVKRTWMRMRCQRDIFAKYTKRNVSGAVKRITSSGSPSIGVQCGSIWRRIQISFCPPVAAAKFSCGWRKTTNVIFRFLELARLGESQFQEMIHRCHGVKRLHRFRERIPENHDINDIIRIHIA